MEKVWAEEEKTVIKVTMNEHVKTLGKIREYCDTENMKESISRRV